MFSSSSSLNLSVTRTNNSQVPNTFSSQSFYHFLESYRLCLKTAHLDSGVSPGLVFVTPFSGIKLCRAFYWDTHSEEASSLSELRHQINPSYLESEPSNNEAHFEKRSDRDTNEMQRRKKTGLSNKGRVQWNKGKKHTAETLELISQRTKEALSDPKVRKKMSECPRTLSDQTKAKIRITITRKRRERLKLKRSREKFISKWTESIAEAAKEGGHGQQELEWDSYEKIEREIAFQHLQRSADRAKAKAEKVKSTLKKKVAKVKGLVKKKSEEEKVKKKSEEEKEELAAAEDLTLKERLTKIHRKISVPYQLSSRHQRAWEKLDIEFLKRDMRKEDISLADQIRDAKNKKAEVFIRGAPTTTPPNHPSP